MTDADAMRVAISLIGGLSALSGVYAWHMTRLIQKHRDQTRILSAALLDDIGHGIAEERSSASELDAATLQTVFILREWMFWRTTRGDRFGSEQVEFWQQARQRALAQRKDALHTNVLSEIFVMVKMAER